METRKQLLIEVQNYNINEKENMPDIYIGENDSEDLEDIFEEDIYEKQPQVLS